MSRITWKDEAPYSASGYCGKVRLFSVTYRTRRDDPLYVMSTCLPQLGYRSWKNDDQAALKKRAESVLAFWLKEIGA